MSDQQEASRKIAALLNEAQEIANAHGIPLSVGQIASTVHVNDDDDDSWGSSDTVDFDDSWQSSDCEW